jgi:hypothetical protein
MAKNSSRYEGTEKRWRRLIGEWRAGGGTVRAFCARRGLSEPSFYSWRRLLAERDGRRPAFVPVQVIPAEPRAGNGALEVVLGGKRTVRVGPGFDAATLRRLLAVLEEKPC